MIAREKRTLKLTRTDVYHIILAALLVWFGNRMFGRKISDYLDHVGLESCHEWLLPLRARKPTKLKNHQKKASAAMKAVMVLNSARRLANASCVGVMLESGQQFWLPT